jgi:hypothetical protein
MTKKPPALLGKVTVHTLQDMKRSGEKIVALTAYDAPMARLLNQAEVDVILVGDSVGNVKLGFPNTLPVTLEHMLHHTHAVRRGNRRAFLVADMPFLTYEFDPKDAVRQVGRLMKEGGAEAVKVEGAGADSPVHSCVDRGQHSCHGPSGAHAPIRSPVGGIPGARAGPRGRGTSFDAGPTIGESRRLRSGVGSRSWAPWPGGSHGR